MLMEHHFFFLFNGKLTESEILWLDYLVEAYLICFLDGLEINFHREWEKISSKLKYLYDLIQKE